MTSEQRPGEIEVTGERRIAPRYDLRLNKLVRAEVEMGGQLRTCYLYVIDMSSDKSGGGGGGVRITTDFDFPAEPVRIKFCFDEPFEARVEVVWHKDLEGGTRVYGMRFVDLSDGEATAVDRFMERYSPEMQRKSFRLNRVMSFEIQSDTMERLYVLVLDLMPSGMRIINDFPLEPGIRVACRLSLEVGRRPVEILARVQSVQATGNERHLIELEFLQLEDGAINRINSYLDRAMRGELDRQSMPPQEIFEDRNSQPDLAADPGNSGS